MHVLLALLVLPALALAAGPHATYHRKGTKGVIKSQNYPTGEYAADTQQRWLITATIGDEITFVFNSPFRTEAIEQTCYDYVQILDSADKDTDRCSSSAKPVAKFCGSTVPQNVTVRAPDGSGKPVTTIFEFCTDYAVEYTGFSVEWHARTSHRPHHTTTHHPRRTTTRRPPPHRTTTTAGTTSSPVSGCGVQAPGYEPIGLNDTRIVGGIHAKPHSWPWAVAIMTDFGGGEFLVYCGGSVINKRWMITAGHCFKDLSEEDWPNYHLKLGADDRGPTNKPNEPSQQVLEIEKAIVNPDFDDYKISHDITLVKFNQDIELNDYVRPICLPSSQETAKGGDDAVTIGWGNTEEGGEEPTKLHQVELPIVDKTICSKDYPGQIDDTMVCAGNEPAGGVDSCQGDSGGALMAKRDGVWKLFGIVSWGRGCAEPHEPGVYGYVPSLVDWVQQTLQQEG